MRSLIRLASTYCVFVFSLNFLSGQEPVSQEAEQIEIARQFVSQMFVDPDEKSLSRFQMSEGMKGYFSSDTFREWAKAIADDYGKPGEPKKIEVIRQENGQHDVYLFCHCNR